MKDEKQVQNQLKSVELTAQILLRTFKDEAGKELEYVSVELPDPFGDEDFVNVAITPKWKNAEIMFKFYAKKHLRTTPKIEFPIFIKAISFKSKSNEVITYPGLIGINPFDGRELEFKVKGNNKDDKNVVIFNSLARNILGLDSANETD